MSRARSITVVIALGLCAIGTFFACGDPLPTEEVSDATADRIGDVVGNDSGSDGESCSASCGGKSGLCGPVNVCGININCGACETPAECKGTSCACSPPACTTLVATCGNEFPNVCDGGVVS